MDSFRRKSLTPTELWKLMAVQSAILIGTGLALLWWNGHSIQLRMPSAGDVLLALVLVAPLLVTSLLLLRFSAAYRRAVELLERVLGPPMRPLDIPLLALASSAVEEFFFRGVLLPWIGLLPSAAMFGLAHVWNRHLWVHGAWAAAAGLYLGLEYQWTGNLALPFLTHAFNNLIGLALLRSESKS